MAASSMKLEETGFDGTGADTHHAAGRIELSRIKLDDQMRRASGRA